MNNEHLEPEEGRMVRMETLMVIQLKETMRLRNAVEGAVRPGLTERMAVVETQQRTQKKAGVIATAGLGVLIATLEGLSRFLA